MMAMALLRSGVVAKLLDAMKNEDAAAVGKDERKPVLLQIRSIIPVLEEGDLWPCRGFYLRVSDKSHAMYVSLPQEQNEMILSNKLKLGQYINVLRLEKADPVPLLIGLAPVPGRRLCEGSPEDMNSPRTLVKFLHSIDTDPVVEEKGVISEEKIKENSDDSSRKLRRGLLPDNSDDSRTPRGRSRSVSASKTRPRMNSIRTQITDDDDDDSDCDSRLSSVSPISKRKSWTQSEILEVKEIFDSSVNKNEIKPVVVRCHSANVSPVRSLRYDSASDDYSTTNGGRRDVKSVKKSKIGAAENVKSSAPKAIQEPNSHPVSSLIHDGKGAETAIAWGTLPAALVKLGKEVVRQRDIALNAAADALQEACAAERLLKSLSTYSELNASEGVDLHQYVDKFSDLQDDLALGKLIVQSLTNITPFKTSENDAKGHHSVKETLNTAVERKKNATTWLKSAVALDLSTSSAGSRNHAAATNASKKSSRCSKPKGASIIKKQRSIDDIHLLMASEKDDHAEWTKGSSLYAATDLANTLQEQFRKLFLDYLEKYLDEFESKTSSMQSDSQIAGMMCKVKRINDLLVLLAGKEPNCNLDDSEREAYGRARDKICGILLNNIDRTTWLCKSANASA